MPTVTEIISTLMGGAHVDYASKGAGGLAISGGGMPGTNGKDKVFFVGSSVTNPAEILSVLQAGLVIVERQHFPQWKGVDSAPGVNAVLWSDNARLDFCRVMNRFFAPKHAAGIDATSTVAGSARIGRDVFIGPGCVIGEGVEIGDSCVLHARVVLYPGTRLGRRAVLHAGVVIGGDGFGFERYPDGSLEKFPHFGGVLIEDDVEIGANSTIDRGSMGDTIVRHGVKIDNLVQVAHNAEIGAHTLLIAGCVVCGGVRIGERCWVSPQVVVRDKLQIGDGVTLGMGAIVNKSVSCKATMVAIPAHSLRNAKRIATFLEKIGNGS